MIIVFKICTHNDSLMYFYIRTRLYLLIKMTNYWPSAVQSWLKIHYLIIILINLITKLVYHCDRNSFVTSGFVFCFIHEFYGTVYKGWSIQSAKKVTPFSLRLIKLGKAHARTHEHTRTYVSAVGTEILLSWFSLWSILFYYFSK